MITELNGIIKASQHGTDNSRHIDRNIDQQSINANFGWLPAEAETVVNNCWLIIRAYFDQ